MCSMTFIAVHKIEAALLLCYQIDYKNDDCDDCDHDGGSAAVVDFAGHKKHRAWSRSRWLL